MFITGLIIIARLLAPKVSTALVVETVPLLPVPATDMPLALNLPPLPSPALIPLATEVAMDALQPLPAMTVNYQHPEGLFEILTDGFDLTNDNDFWLVSQESSDALVLVDVARTMTFTIQTVNTAYQLDQDSLLRLAQAREQLRQVSGNDLSLNQPEFTMANSVTVKRSYQLGGKNYLSISTYRDYETMVAITELVLPQERYQFSPEWVEQHFDSVEFHPEILVAQPAYARVVTVSDPENLFSLEVPDAWTAEIIGGEYTWVATFTSPDQHAVIQVLRYDDGEPLSGFVAGDFALFLLNTYLASEPQIFYYKRLPDGREQLDWVSPWKYPDYRGISSFRSLGTSYVMLTVMVDLDYEDIYLPVLDRAQESFRLTVSAAESGE
ncbi:MAG: hypothetical protein JW862_09925 [Anaerolineales bacterium]|nr:hypothetical protein [Anaerolineales bacterium]